MAGCFEASVVSKQVWKEKKKKENKKSDFHELESLFVNVTYLWAWLYYQTRFFSIIYFEILLQAGLPVHTCNPVLEVPKQADPVEFEASPGSWVITGITASRDWSL